MNKSGVLLELIYETYLAEYPQITGANYTMNVALINVNKTSGTGLEEFIEEATANIIAGGNVI